MPFYPPYDEGIGPIGPTGPQGEIGPTGATGPQGEGVASGGTIGMVLTKSNETDYQTQWTDPHTNAGQVKVDYTGITLTTFVAEVAQIFDISSGVATIEPYTLSWPLDHNPDPQYDPDFFDAANNRLRENPAEHQVHIWRVRLGVTGKSTHQSVAVDLEFFNPNSDFSVNQCVVLPINRTNTIASFDIITIADQYSIPEGDGYQISVRTSDTTTITVELLQILRVSMSTERVLLVLP